MPTSTADSVGHVIGTDVKGLLLRLLATSSREDCAVLADPFCIEALASRYFLFSFRMNASVANDVVRTIAIGTVSYDSIEEECLRL